MSDAKKFREEEKINRRLAEIAEALPDAEVIRTDFSKWEVYDGEHDGMSLAEYVRRFNKPEATS